MFNLPHDSLLRLRTVDDGVEVEVSADGIAWHRLGTFEGNVDRDITLRRVRVLRSTVA